MTSVCAVAALKLSWKGEPTTIPDEGSPSLKALARATWIGLLIQTALGALYRHQIVGLVPHVAGAMLVMGMVMYAGIAAFSTDGAPPAVKRPALILLIMTGVQMLIGLGAYLYRMELREQATGQSAMLTFTVMHVAVGALTTACFGADGMQILRYVRPGVVSTVTTSHKTSHHVADSDEHRDGLLFGLTGAINLGAPPSSSEPAYRLQTGAEPMA
jgi:heme A synthase